MEPEGTLFKLKELFSGKSYQQLAIMVSVVGHKQGHTTEMKSIGD